MSLNPIAGRRVAIVGGAGFVGHHLALELVEQGAEVTIIDSLQVNNLMAVMAGDGYADHRELYMRILNERLDLLRGRGIPVIVQDARDYHALGRLLSEVDPHVVVHAAAVAHADRSNKDPFTTFDHSLRTLENALDFARGGLEHFIYLSSSMVYGHFQTAEVAEDHPLEPMGIYGALKVAGEKMVIAYGQVFDLPYTIIRPSALYGPRCVSRRVGQVFIENAIAGRPVRVWGDGSDRLDFTYVQDLVDGLILAMRHPGARDQIFNMTYGSSRSLADLLAIVQEEFPLLEVERMERDRLMPRRGTLSVDRAREIIGYDPQYPVDIGIPDYIDWYRRLTAEPMVAYGRRRDDR
ncbi:MAG TPA: NAD(P)-dependent oxidoreductase [Miltoncostaeaceae bacterium]|nr:NAD(P)-dependent oxidoreductase [Miltoncostaeaceae bacterium]